jgi:hypothetical protein
MTAYGEGLRPVPPYGGNPDVTARPLSPLCPHQGPPPSWVYWGYHCTQDAGLRRKYGITCDTYYRLLEQQGGVCGACGKKEKRALAVDHDHEPPYEIRGLLCTYCNRALSRGLVRYLASPPARKAGPLFVPEERIAKVREDTQKRLKRRRVVAATKREAKKRTTDPPSELDKLRTMTKQGGS